MIYLLITARFLDDRYHGLIDRQGPPEWPPSPFRLFQAFLAGVARRGELDSMLGESLAWLETLDPPIIISPRSRDGQVITRFVPNNDGDKKPNRQDRLTAKTSRPTIMLDTPEVHYLWAITEGDLSNADGVQQASIYLTSLGWGIDMAYARVQRVPEVIEINRLPGVRWYPRPGVWRDIGMLRIPVKGSLDDLKQAHQFALSRIEHGKPLKTVQKPKVFDYVFYESEERLLSRPYAVFELRNDDGTRFSYPQARLIHIAGMVRHLAIEMMKVSPPAGVDDDWIEIYVAGHAHPDEQEHRQFSYLPLPSIGHAHTDPSVRRVMITAPLGDDQFLNHLAMLLAGQKLNPTECTNLDHPPTLIRIRWDNVADLYTRPAARWASVTPVILPGHDDHKPDKTRKLIEKALHQSGINQPCEFEWSAFSQFPKSLSAHKYDRKKRPTGYVRPDHLLSQTAVHLKLRFKENLKVPGPLIIGAGRHCGLGLFASMESS